MQDVLLVSSFGLWAMLLVGVPDANDGSAPLPVYLNSCFGRLASGPEPGVTSPVAADTLAVLPNG